jgi:hypothetical protein
VDANPLEETDMRAIMAALLLFSAPFAAWAQSVTVERIDILDKGLYAIETGAGTAQANTPTGEVTAVTGSRNIEVTSAIAAKVGGEFGFRYTAIGEPAGAEVPFDIVIAYPKQGLTNPDTKTTLHESRYSQTKKIGEISYLGYGFEHDWEAEPGTWVFQIWHDGRKLADETFTVTK